MLPPVELWRAARGVTPTGPKRTYSRASAMSASEGKADIKYGRMSTRPSTTLADLEQRGIPKSVFL